MSEKVEPTTQYIYPRWLHECLFEVEEQEQLLAKVPKEKQLIPWTPERKAAMIAYCHAQFPPRPVVAISEDRQWEARLDWTDKPDNFAWFLFRHQPGVEYDALDIVDSIDDTGQSPDEALAAFLKDKSQ